MKIICKTHGIVEGKFVGQTSDVACETCLSDAYHLALANSSEPWADIVSQEQPLSMSMTVYRNEPDITGIED